MPIRYTHDEEEQRRAEIDAAKGITPSAEATAKIAGPVGSLSTGDLLGGFDDLLKSLDILEAGHRQYAEEASAFVIHEARRRLENQRSFLRRYAEAADGLLTSRQQAAIPGSGIDGHRDAGNLRAIIAALSLPKTPMSHAHSNNPTAPSVGATTETAGPA